MISGVQSSPADQEKPQAGDEDDEITYIHFPAYTKDSIRVRLEQTRRSLELTATIKYDRLWRDYWLPPLLRPDHGFPRHLSDAVCFAQDTPGHGKSTTLSMVEYFYDVLRKKDFRHHFERFGIGYRIIHQKDDWEHSHCFVLKLDFGELAVREPGFNFNTPLNMMLHAFVRRYASLIPKLSNVSFEKESAGKTLDCVVSHLEGHSRIAVCIDNYDAPYWNLQGLGLPRPKYEELYSQLTDFLSALARWNATCLIPLVMLAGESNVVDLLSNRLGRTVCDIVGGLDLQINAHRKDMLGLTEHETKLLGYRLDDDFHSLGLAHVGRDYVESEEGRRYWKKVGQYYGLCFSKILDFYANNLEDALKNVDEEVPVKTMPLTEFRRSNR
ncbi:hypothetical protein V5O48_004730 [Marasmius crinis-equi]|uniref:AAA-ATPase-like domain-containing protein n=1 Tax=Marasmius crinis-equi TaxID=585013 RepID=A0ABR3FP66_9AGAR